MDSKLTSCYSTGDTESFDGGMMEALAADIDNKIQQARSHMAQGSYQSALPGIQYCLSIVRDPDVRITLLVDRCKCYIDFSKQLRSIPASESETSAQFGLDPSQLAKLGCKDAEKVLQQDQGNVEAAVHLGQGQLLLEDYKAAEAAFLHVLSLDATNASALEGIANVNKIVTECRQQQRSLAVHMDDLDCTICCKLLFKPVTTPCGHTFCQDCFSRSMDHNSKCPMCRRVLHSGIVLPVSVVLQNVIKRSFPEETAARERESQSTDTGMDSSASSQRRDLPMFVMAFVLPGETIQLNIFEPRYRLMVRRCMEGNRRLALSIAMQSSDEQGAHILPPAVTECEITECQLQPDGRYYLELTGIEAVTLVSDWEVDGYRVCAVTSRPSEPTSPEVLALSQRMEARVEELLREATAQAQRTSNRMRSMMMQRMQEIGTKPSRSDPDAIAWWVARAVPLSPSQKLQLLMQDTVHARLTTLQSILDDPQSTQNMRPSQCCIM